MTNCTLQTLIDLKVGATFLFRGKKGTVIWTDFVREDLGKDKEGKPMVRKDFGMYFSCEGAPEGVTIRSCWPQTQMVMADFSL